MNRFCTCLLMGGMFLSASWSEGTAQTADTIWVNTFNFSDPSPTGWSAPYRGTYMFPDTSEEFERILMYYTLKCDPATNQDNFDCGEWDYLTYTYVVDSSGWYDSTFRSNPNFRYLDGSVADSLSYTFDQTYSYTQEEQPYITYLDTLSLNTAQLGIGTQLQPPPFQTDLLSGKSQFLWKRNELGSAGLQPGLITGMRLDLSSLGTEVRKLRIRMGASASDSLTGFEASSGNEVYYQTTTFADTGWQSLAFYQPFNWDGNSNILVEMAFENQTEGIASPTTAEIQALPLGVFAGGRDHYLDFNGNDVIDLGTDPQIQGTAPRTFEAWVYTRSFNGGGLFQAGPTGQTGADFSMRTMGADDLWRVQMWGTPDFDVTLPGSKDAWHHIALTHENGTARLYYDGGLIHTEPVGINTGASRLWLGRWGGSRFDGLIDDFRMWNVALDEATIAAWKDRSILSAHPNLNNLVVYLPMDEGSGLVALDESGNGHHGDLQGPPAWVRLPVDQLRKDIHTSLLRPNAIFEQGVFQSTVNVNVVTDSLPDIPLQVVLFGNPSGPYIIPDDFPLHPSFPTDTLQVFRANRYIPIIGTSGTAVDSLFVPADSTVIRDDHEYYSNIVRYEIGRYITPYGIGLDLGPDGTRWIFDVTDYSPILHDAVYLQAGNNQELLDLRFAMIKGTPARTVQKVEKLWAGSFSYASIWNDQNGQAITKYLSPSGDDFRVKMRISGHGFGGPSNCAEFCPRHHSILLNDTEAFNWEVWDECSDNFVYPQGGTWIYDRAGWCPGGIVTTQDLGLKGLVQAGDTVNIDYAIEDPAPQAPEGNYVVEGQLVTYGPPNKQVDVAIEEILAPNTDKRFSRSNPICDHPRVLISNQGAQPITKLNFTFGVEGGLAPCYFSWEGNLGFLESTEIEFPLFNWFGLDSNNPVFYVEVDVPGSTDENLNNNRRQSSFEIPRQFAVGSILEVQTNFAAFENAWYITNAMGDTVMSRTNLSSNTLYQDTLNLPRGCYAFHFTDTGEDGISWWANNDGNGYVFLLNPDGTFQSRWNGDYGKDIYEQFTVLTTLGNGFDPELACDSFTTSIFRPELPIEGSLEVYPNPSTGSFAAHILLDQPADMELEVLDAVGRVVHRQQLSQQREHRVHLQLELAAGWYLVQVRTPNQRLTQSVVIQ
ncbi:MAG: LamG-like jellyroll fold domain-containing protein [Bacteroidota bacterium]